MPTAYRPVTLPEPVRMRLREGDWRVAITGASGWMGQALLEALEAVFPEDYATRVVAFGFKAPTLTLRSGRVVALQPIEEIRALPPAKWLLVHAAYATKDKVSVQGNAAYVSGNEQLTELVSAAIRAVRPAAILFPSSGAVYAKDGSISTNLHTNPYGVLKHRDEEHFAALAAEVGARIIIPRVFNMGGPYINKWSAYALSDLIVKLLQHKQLLVQSAGAVVRSYVHVGDILALSFAWLTDQTPHAPVLMLDTHGEEAIEIADLVRRIEQVMLGEVRSDPRQADAQAPSSIYLGKAEPMQSLCAQYDIKIQSLEAQIRDTAEYIQAVQSSATAA